MDESAILQQEARRTQPDFVVYVPQEDDQGTGRADQHNVHE